MPRNSHHHNDRSDDINYRFTLDDDGTLHVYDGYQWTALFGSALDAAINRLLDALIATDGRTKRLRDAVDRFHAADGHDVRELDEQRHPDGTDGLRRLRDAVASRDIRQHVTWGGLLIAIDAALAVDGS